MKRNFSKIRSHLRSGSALDRHNADLLAEMEDEDRDALAGIDDNQWEDICEKAKRAGLFHRDIRSPALSIDLILGLRT